jgi:hypothetical protein
MVRVASVNVLQSVSRHVLRVHFVFLPPLKPVNVISSWHMDTAWNAFLYLIAMGLVMNV